MDKEPRLTLASLTVLRIFADQPTRKMAGSDIYAVAKISSGTLYPILLRFEKAGWLKSDWEDCDPSEEGRPRKRLYRLTPTGYARAQESLRFLAQEKPQWA